jgi:hypothetical protein
MMIISVQAVGKLARDRPVTLQKESVCPHYSG